MTNDTMVLLYRSGYSRTMENVASTLVWQARSGARLSQSRLAVLSTIQQPNISRAEKGNHDLSVDTLDRLVRAAGWRLAVLPTRSDTVGAAASAAAAAVHAGRPEAFLVRVVLQLADHLAHEHGAERVALTVSPPAPTGDARIDAFIAGVAEHRLNEENLPHPRWLAAAARLVTPWTPAGVKPERPVPALEQRGVLVDESDLVSV
ncbi:MAG: Cro/Cl family transcriptional regulator [Ilumatobacteraceae bacterium]